MELKCSAQNYSWGKQGNNSMVAMLMKSSNPEFNPKVGVPYAELWMGTHPNGPSFLKAKNISLDKYIQQNSYILGNAVKDLYGVKLPFLFKVLSIEKALSIQVHPNKKQAIELHQIKPEIYKDANHKPELAIALTPFEALCGFRPISEIKNFFKVIPELYAVVEKSQIAHLFSCNEIDEPNVLKNCFENLMLQVPGIIDQQLRKLIKRLSNLDESTRLFLNADLLERLSDGYPGDVGCFGIYLFNYIKLQSGEAIFLNTNEPHAYLFGDCIECMGCSDNVVRAGLTTKIKDIETLIKISSYDCKPAQDKRFYASKEDDYTVVFRPPIQDFAVAKITIPPGKISYSTIQRNSASILIVISGKAEISFTGILNSGSVLFIPANESINIKTYYYQPMLMFQAFANI